MRDRILDILSFLSQSVSRDKDLFYDSQEIWDHLTTRGFSEEDIEHALFHIERSFLEAPGSFWSEGIPVYRIYNSEEIMKVSTRARGFLWQLKCKGVIDHALEDEIVQKAMELEEEAGMKEIKTVAALTIFGYEHRTRTNADDSGSRYQEYRLN